MRTQPEIDAIIKSHQAQQKKLGSPASRERIGLSRSSSIDRVSEIEISSCYSKPDSLVSSTAAAAVRRIMEKQDYQQRSPAVRIISPPTIPIQNGFNQ